MGVAALSGLAAVSAPATAQPPDSGIPASSRVEEIVVTARKRPELLEEAPISVTVLGPDTLQATEVRRLEDIQNLIPNLQMSEQFGSAVGAGVAIRGVVTEDPAIALDPGVGIYVDGVFLPRAAGQLMDILDVELIEILRGPQGTLFGRSTIGGAINVITAKPKPDLEAYARVRPGNFGSVDTQAMLNVPVPLAGLEDRLFTRFAFGSVERDGYVFDDVRDEHVANRSSLAFLGSLRFLPTDDVVIDVSGTWSRSSARPRAGECVVVSETPIGSSVPGFQESCRETEPFRTSVDTASRSSLESYGTWGTATWDVGKVGILDHLTLRSLTSWREQRPRMRLDLDSTGLPIAESATGVTPSTGRPAFQRQVSQEVQVSASTWAERLRLTAGGFGFWEKAIQDAAVQILPPVIGTAQVALNTNNSTWALFGQATVDPTSWLSLTGGVRYTLDHKDVDYVSTPPGAPEPAVAFSDGASFSAWTPMASISARVPESWLIRLSLDSLLAYFSYARGFRSGGFDAVASPVPRIPQRFSPETLDSFELGIKVVGFERRVMLNLALFQGNYDNIQVYQLISTPAGPPDAAILNAAEATTRGVELEVQAFPIHGLQLTGSLGFLDAEYDSFEGISDLDGGPINRDGQRFQNVPELETHVGIQYSFPLRLRGPAWLDGDLTPRLDWSYRGSVDYLGPEVPAGKQRGYNLLDSRLSYDLWEDDLQIALWGKNLTDEEYFDFVFPLTTLSGTIARLYQVPRTFGGEVSVYF